MSRSQTIEDPGIIERRQLQAAQGQQNPQSTPNFNAGKVSGKPRFKAIQ